MSALTVEGAVAIWQATRTNNIIKLARVITAETQIDEIVRGIVLEIVRDNYKPALAWLAGAILDAGHNLDEKLKWDFIRNESIKQWFEDHDDIGMGLLRVINALADVIEEDCRSVQGQDADELAAEVCLDLLGGGNTPDFFKDGPGLKRSLSDLRPGQNVRRPRILQRLAEKAAALGQKAEEEPVNEASVVEEPPVVEESAAAEVESAANAEAEEVEEVEEVEEIEEVEESEPTPQLPFGLKARSQN